MALYESEHTRWMRELLIENPEWVEDQKRGRAIWWDRFLVGADDVNLARSEPHKAYPYDNNFGS